MLFGGFFKSWKSHYTAGFLYGVTLRALPKSVAEQEIVELDRWAWAREWKQNQAGQDPNDPMSDRQIKEAVAWGLGARKARGVNPPLPVPPY
jgi:hypothetical protein